MLTFTRVPSVHILLVNSQQHFPLTVNIGITRFHKNDGLVTSFPDREWQFDPEGSFEFWHAAIVSPPDMT